MSSCCASNDADARPCPACGHVGPIVGVGPVRPHRPEALPGDWQYCANEQCGVVYHLDENTIDADSVITQVGIKATEKPTPVCFCYAHTTASLEQDLAENDGTSQIKASIKTAVAEGSCACEHLNPSSNCCLSDVHRTVKALLETTTA